MKKLKPTVSVLALIISILSAFYAWSGVQQAKESNNLARKALHNSENLFLVEKRPYINIEIAKLNSGRYLDITHGTTSAAIFSLEIKNEGGIPARNIEVYIKFLDVQRYLDSKKLNQYNEMSLFMPETQKIFPNKSHSIDIQLSGAENNLADKEIDSQHLLFQVLVKYKSDVGEGGSYLTTKQFLVTPSRITLVGNLGEFN